MSICPSVHPFIWLFRYTHLYKTSCWYLLISAGNLKTYIYFFLSTIYHLSLCTFFPSARPLVQLLLDISTCMFTVPKWAEALPFALAGCGVGPLLKSAVAISGPVLGRSPLSQWCIFTVLYGSFLWGPSLVCCRLSIYNLFLLPALLLRNFKRLFVICRLSQMPQSYSQGKLWPALGTLLCYSIYKLTFPARLVLTYSRETAAHFPFPSMALTEHPAMHQALSWFHWCCHLFTEHRNATPFPSQLG